MATKDKTKQELEEENHALQNMVYVLTSERAEVKKKNEDLRLIHLRQENRSNQLRREIDELASDNKVLCDRVGDLEATNNTLRKNVAAMNANVDQWENYASEARDDLIKLSSYTNRIREQQKSETARVAELKARLKDLQERNEDLEERLITKKIKAQASKAEHDELERKHKALWRTVNYLDQIVEEDQNEVMRLRQGVLCLKELWESHEQQ